MVSFWKDINGSRINYVSVAALITRDKKDIALSDPSVLFNTPEDSAVYTALNSFFWARVWVSPQPGKMLIAKLFVSDAPD